MARCQNCGAVAPTKYVEFNQIIGLLIVFLTKSIKGHLCKNCINEYFWRFSGTSLVLGWWGVISLVLTPLLLLNNIIRYLFTLGLEAPTQYPATMAFTEASVERIKPYTREIVERLGTGEKVEQVAQSIAARTGTTTEQVLLYVMAVAQIAKKY